MKDVWERIEKWFRAHVPNVLEDLYEGASDNDIKALEAQWGVVLPNDLRASLQIYDGEDGLHSIAAPWLLFSLRQMALEVKDMRAFAQNQTDTGEMEARGPVKSMLWNSAWVPFAGDGSGNLLCVDLDPEPAGHRGQVIQWAADPPFIAVVAESFRAWLIQFADELSAGKFHWDKQNKLWLRTDSE